MIPYGRQDISEDDIRAVVEVLRSDFLTQGPAVPTFEQALLASCGGQHAVAMNSATSALHVACAALGVGPGDTVWTSPITFVASANCALYCGAAVDFVDIDPRTWNMDVNALAAKLAHAKDGARLPKLVIPVHFAGQPCDMAAIHDLSLRYGFRVVEDASHAIGARYRDTRTGDGRYSDVTIFSFHPVKIVTTAEGGVAVTNDAALAARMRLLRSHGITREPALMENAPHGGWYYEQIALGFNYRMTDVQAALGTSQLKRIDAFIDARRALARRYDARLARLPLTRPYERPDCRSAYHLYVVRVPARSHSAVFAALRDLGIGVNLHYIPVYLQPYYRHLGFTAGLCPQAEAYYREAISLPMYAALTDAHQDTVIAALTGALEAQPMSLE